VVVVVPFGPVTVVPVGPEPGPVWLPFPAGPTLPGVEGPAIAPGFSFAPADPEYDTRSHPRPPPRRASTVSTRFKRTTNSAERGEDGLLGIDAIADTYWNIHEQRRSAWTQEVDLRPFKEPF
jgi:hypothetical protein